MDKGEEKITDMELAARQQTMLRRALHDNRLVTIDNPNFIEEFNEKVKDFENKKEEYEIVKRLFKRKEEENGKRSS